VIGIARGLTNGWLGDVETQSFRYVVFLQFRVTVCLFLLTA